MTKSLFLSLVVLLLVGCSDQDSPIQETTEHKTVVIDLGHGGSDNGFVSDDGHSEKDVLLQLAEVIKQRLDNPNLSLHFIRDTDDYISLQNRAKRINELSPDLVLSLHTNASDDRERNGMEFFYSDKNVAARRSKTYAEQFHDRSIVENNRVRQAGFYLLKSVEAPTLVVELGYLSHPGDAEFLTSTTGQIALADYLLGVLGKNEAAKSQS